VIDAVAIEVDVNDAGLLDVDVFEPGLIVPGVNEIF
jgi:hypothetical protein